MSKLSTIEKLREEKKKPVLPRITCTKCATNKVESSFYRSYDSSIKTKRIPFCKECIQSSSRDSEGNITLDLLKQTLKEIDRPFIEHLYESSLEENINNPIGVYFKNIGISRYRELKWADSEFTGDGSDPAKPKRNKKSTKTKKLTQKQLERAWELFGFGFEDDEYANMMKKYNFIRNNYPGTTNLHIEHLTKYVIYSVKEESAIVKNELKEAKDYAALRRGAATDAKLNISQLSKSDLQGGLNSFSEFSRAVEAAVDIIPILPKFKFAPNDAPDFIIWCYINYIRETEGRPTIEYSDIYSFYDKKKEQYLEQYGDPYGIFEGDTSEENRQNIAKFITIPDELDGGD